MNLKAAENTMTTVFGTGSMDTPSRHVRTANVEAGLTPSENVPLDLSILIVCYQSRELILPCLRSVEQHTIGCTYEVLMVDCSNDGAVDLVKSEFPKTRIIENTENLGFGKGNNVLETHAVAPYLLLLNPDVILTDDSISELFRTAVSMPKAGAIGGRTRMLNGERDPGCRQFAPTLFRLAVSVFGGAHLFNGGLPESAEDPAQVETLSGAFMIVRKDAWREIGGFDTSFFMYSEELDFCHRLIQAGWSVMMTPRAELIHLVGSGEGQNPKRVFSITKARMHYIRKSWSHGAIFLAGILIWAHAAVRVLASIVGLPILGRDRAQRLREPYAPIVVSPYKWWYGYAADNRAVVNRPTESQIRESGAGDLTKKSNQRQLES